MALWLLCCILLFITSRGYDWLSQQSWFGTPELSLPWLVLGGLGLAIASNYKAWQSLTTPKTAATVPGDPLVPPTRPTPPTPTDAPLSAPPRLAPPLSSSPAKRSASISFEVTTTKAGPSKT